MSKSDAQKVADLLLQVAGVHVSGWYQSRRHAQALDEALQYMDKDQKQVAIARIQKLETKWGSLLEIAPETAPVSSDEIAPMDVLVRWLWSKKHPERILRIMQLTSEALMAGETRLSVLLDKGYAGELDGVVRWVGYRTFSEWLKESRTAKSCGRGEYRPDSSSWYLCGYGGESQLLHVGDMEQIMQERSQVASTRIAACLKRLQEQRAAHASAMRARRSARSSAYKQRMREGVSTHGLAVDTVTVGSAHEDAS